MNARLPVGWSLVLGLSLAGVGGCIPDVVPSAGSDGALPPSCAGLEAICGPLSDEDCCASPLVPGGSFTRLDNRDPTDTPHDATVSSFLLDRFEVTVGRFRRFVEAYPESKPAAGAGAHPAAPGASGWSPAWDALLPADRSSLIDQVTTTCDVNYGGQGYPTYTDDPAGAELPMNCLSWFVAFAFCAWDGGRLPTEAEWGHAAAGGDEQRVYPWGDQAPDAGHAVYDCMGDGSASADCAPSDIVPVGSRSPVGDGRWGQADLSGSVFDWVLDVDAPYGDDPCVDCMAIDGTSSRIVRGGAWFELNDGGRLLMVDGRNAHGFADVLPDLGVRCARDR